MPRRSSLEIDIEAVKWVARLDRAPLSGREQEALDAWLQGDPRCAGAFARARGVALYTERARALAPNFDPDEFLKSSGLPPRCKRPRWVSPWWLGAAAVAASIVLPLVLVGLPEVKPSDPYATRLGEMRVIPLADGSIMTLNTNSQAMVDFSDFRRSIQLIQGEALFDVTRDAQRPFEVDAGDTRVRAIGTRFTVRRSVEQPVEVLVSEGAVEVASPRSLPSPVRVGANMRLVAVEQAVPVLVQPAELQRQLAWREGRIAFEGETLGQAAAQFARYSDVRIVIGDSALAEERITGLFLANDPVGFSRAVAISLGLEVEVASSEVRLLR
jgi:transmembrane sensor